MQISTIALLALIVSAKLGIATSPRATYSLSPKSSDSESDDSPITNARTPTPEAGEPYVPWYYLSNGTVIMRDAYQEEEAGRPLPPMDRPHRLADEGRCLTDPPFACRFKQCIGRGVVFTPPYRCTNARPWLRVVGGALMVIIEGCRCCPEMGRCSDPECDGVEGADPSRRDDMCRSEALRGCRCERERKPVVHTGPDLWVDEKGMQWMRAPPY